MTKIADIETACADLFREQNIAINLLAQTMIGQAVGRHPLVTIGACLVAMQYLIDSMVLSRPVAEQRDWHAGVQQVIQNGIRNFDRTRQLGLGATEGSA